MKKPRLIIMVIFSIFVTITVIYADSHKQKRSRKEGVQPVTNTLYRDKCGQCHFVYSPGLLPGRSWEKLMLSKNVKDHPGGEIRLSDDDKNKIMKYLVENSADKSTYERSLKINREISKSETPLRVTETSYIMQKHRKIPSKLIKENEEVESLSNCIACHKEAENGIFDDDTVIIPGYGRWDDD